MQTLYAVFADMKEARDAVDALKKADLSGQILSIVAEASDTNEEADLSTAASFAWMGDQTASAVAGGMDITGGGGLFAQGGVGAGGGTLAGGATSPWLTDAILISEAPDEKRAQEQSKNSPVTLAVSMPDGSPDQTEIQNLLAAYGAQMGRKKSAG